MFLLPVFKITSLTPADLPVRTAGNLIFHEQRNDSLISIWEQKIPVGAITITAENADACNTTFDNNMRDLFNINDGYYCSYTGENNEIGILNYKDGSILL